MEHKQLFDLLKTLNMPVAYDHFNSNKTINPPFIVYRETSPDVLIADGITYYRPYNFEIELVTETKSVALEKTIEKLFNDNNIPYEVDSFIWDDEEKIYHNFYNI